MKKIRIGLLFLVSILLVSGLVCGDGAHRVWTDKDKTYLGSDTIEVDSIFRSRLIWFMGLSSTPDDSEGVFYYNTTADPGTAYYYDGTSWIAVGYASGGDSVMYADSAEFADSAGITKTGFVQSLWDAIQDSCDTVAFADTADYTKSGFTQTLWDAIQDTCDSVLYADSAFHSYKSDTTDTAHFAWNAESLGGIVHDDYLGAQFDDTATAELFFDDTLHIKEDILIEWAYPDEYAWAGYSGGTWSLETQNAVDILIKGDSLIFQSIGEGNNRGISFLDSSGSVIAYFTNDGDLAFNPTNAADIWLLDTLSAAEYSGVKEYVSDSADQVRSEIGDSALLTTRQDTMPYYLYLSENTFLEDGKYFYLSWSGLSGFLGETNTTHIMNVGTAETYTLRLLGEKIRLMSRAEGTDTLAVFADSSGDIRLSVLNDGTITFADAYEFPNADGTIDQILKTNGTGTLTWQDESGGGVTAGEVHDSIDVARSEMPDSAIANCWDDADIEMIYESHLYTNDVAPTDEYVLSYEATGDMFEWVVLPGGSPGDSSWREISVSFIRPYTGEDTISVGIDWNDTLRLRARTELYANIDFSLGSSNIIIGDNQATSIQFLEGANPYLTFRTTNASETVKVHVPLNINGQYGFPLIDGSNTQVMKTNGIGILSWQDDATGDSSWKQIEVQEILPFIDDTIKIGANADDTLRVRARAEIYGALNINNAYTMPQADGVLGETFITDASGAISWDHDTLQATFTIYDDGDWDNEAVPIWISPVCSTSIVQVNAAVIGSATPILTYNIEEREWASLASAGTDIYSADQTADADGEIETAFSNAGISAESHLVFTTGTSSESGTVDIITVGIYYIKHGY